MAAAAPIASRQLAQAWQAFKASAVTRSSVPQVGPKSAAGVLISDAAAASSTAAAGALILDTVAAASAAASAAAAAAPSGGVTGAEHGRPGMGQQADAADDPEDEEVSKTIENTLNISSVLHVATSCLKSTVPYIGFLLCAQTLQQHLVAHQMCSHLPAS